MKAMTKRYDEFRPNEQLTASDEEPFEGEDGEEDNEENKSVIEHSSGEQEHFLQDVSPSSDPLQSTPKPAIEQANNTMDTLSAATMTVTTTETAPNIKDAQSITLPIPVPERQQEKQQMDSLPSSPPNAIIIPSEPHKNSSAPIQDVEMDVIDIFQIPSKFYSVVIRY